MDLSDERFHRRRVPWRTLTKDGYEPQKVMLAAQKKGLWKLAASAKQRLENQRRDQV
jgi:hypothetical protein